VRRQSTASSARDSAAETERHRAQVGQRVAAPQRQGTGDRLTAAIGQRLFGGDHIGRFGVQDVTRAGPRQSGGSLTEVRAQPRCQHPQTFARTGQVDVTPEVAGEALVGDGDAARQREACDQRAF
jgi:hypothetical protein